MRRLVGLWLAAIAACGGGDDPGTPDAPPPGEPGTFALAGVVRYEDREPLVSGALGPPTPQPARAISVAVIADDGGATLAMGVTGDDGSYQLTYDALGGQPVHLLAIASNTSVERPVEVVRTDNQIHGFGGATLAAGVDTTHDLLIPVDSGEAGAFNVFDQLVNVMDRARTSFGIANPVPLRAVWQIGSPGTFYDGAAIHLLGDASDDDGFDDTVILHEAGHYVEDVYGRTDSPGGGHNGSPTDPRLAWSEGFSTYFAMAVRDVPIYMDSNAGGGFSFNSDTEVTKANPNGPLSQPVAEDMITQILWDLGDAGAQDDDAVAGNHDAVLALQPFVRTASLRAVGTSGMDLVDALDAFFVLAGLGDCDGAFGIVNTARTFPYDYGGAAGPCP